MCGGLEEREKKAMSELATATGAWTPDDQAAAKAEGWAIFECDDSDNGRWQLQSFDDPEAWGLDPATYPFAEDVDAWMHVFDQAAQGSELHARALAFLATHNPVEHRAILSWAENRSRWEATDEQA